MITHWDEFEISRTATEPMAPRVSLTTRGQIHMNARAQELIGNPDHVVLFFDRIGSRIGIRPGTAETPHALRLYQSGDSRSKFLRAMKFCSYHQIRVAEARVFLDPFRDENGFLVLDLKHTRRSRERFDGQYAAEMVGF